MAKKRKGIFYKIFDNPKIKEYDGHITEEMFNKMFSKIAEYSRNYYRQFDRQNDIVFCLM